MTVEEMIKLLGVKTQSEDSIELCYKMDIEAFHMLAKAKNKSFQKEIDDYTSVYKYLMHKLNYKKLNSREKEIIEEKIKDISYKDEDEDYRNTYFHGLERTLLRFGAYDLIIISPERDARHKVAYIYELSSEYEKAIAIYTLLKEYDRIEICKQKQNKNK